jgi:hypothetical protein
LLDEHSRVAPWRLANTWPDVKAKGKDVTIEEIVIAHERLEIEP